MDLRLLSKKHKFKKGNALKKMSMVLRRACVEKDPQALMKCLENGISLDGNTLLHLICRPQVLTFQSEHVTYCRPGYNSSKATITCLQIVWLFGNPDVNSRDSKGETPLMLAAVARSVPVMRHLLMLGAKLELGEGKTYNPGVQRYIKRIRILALFVHEERLPLMLIQYGLAPLL